MNRSNRLKVIRMWLMFTYGATDVEFNNDENIVTFILNEKESKMFIQWIDIVSDSFLYNKETFAYDYVMQSTPSYLAILNTKKVKVHLTRYKQFINKGIEGWMKVAYDIVKPVIEIVKFERDAVQENINKI